LDHTFGKKGKRLEEEIRDLAEERNAVDREEKRPLYRKVSACDHPSRFLLLIDKIHHD
jgi:hypothetical protein